MNIASRLGGWSARHRKSAIFGWLLLVVVATLVGGMAGKVGLSNADQGVGDSARALRVLDDAHIQDPATEMVLVQGKNGTAAIKDVRERVQATGAVTNLRPTRYSTDRGAALITFDITGDPGTADQRVQPVMDAVAAVQQDHADVRIGEVGDASGDKWFSHMIGDNFKRAEWTAVPLALGILLITFGALLAAVLPVALAVTSFLIALGLLNVVSHVQHLDDSVNSVMLLMGLAVGVDYCLFYIRREREERALGRSREDALRIAAATSGRSVLVSGLTVLAAMAGFFLSGMNIFEGFAVATMIVVVVAMTASVTVLPAMLSLLGDRVEFGRMPWRWFRTPKRGPAKHRFWGAVLRPVLAKPGLSTVLAGLFLLVLAAPAVGLHTEKLSEQQLLPSTAPMVSTFNVIAHDFPGGPSPAMVVLKADLGSAAVKQEISTFQAAEPGVRTTLYPDAGVARFDVPLAGDGTDAAARASLTKLRESTVPDTLGRAGSAYVGGSLAFSQDFNHQLSVSIVPVFAFVLGMAFLLMLLCFRSLVVAITSIVLNLLSVAATYGVMVAIFQHGWGTSLLDTTAPGALESWIPLFIFVVLFGLSMDYHVFVVSRIKEAVDGGMPTRAAIAHGIHSTAGVVTSAAAIMVAVFAVFATLSMQDFKQLGVGLAVAILLDATIVRAVLLPAVMSLLGERNWYLPFRRPRPAITPEAERVTV